MLKLLYGFITIILYTPYSIIIFFRSFIKKEHKSKFKEKLFFNKIKRPDGFLFWFHVASLGEFNSILPFINHFLEKNKKNNFLITTVTLSSYNEFKKKFGDNRRVLHQFLPYDLSLLVNNFLKIWRPNIVSFVDSEIWPNFIFNVRKRNIPLVLLNARITNKTFKRWSFLKKFSNIIFKKFSVCIASSKHTKKNLEMLNANNIKYFGNIKFCSDIENKKGKFEDKFYHIKDKKIWCAVSTHNGEELFCSKVQKILKEKENNTMCIIIPRHVNRNKKILSILQDQGLRVQIKDEKDKINKHADIVLINYYGAVQVFLSNIKNVFIGKSLVKKLDKVGGQNPIEAAKMNCSIFHGPYVSNFYEIYEYLRKQSFAQEINDVEDLASELLKKFNKNNEVLDNSKMEELKHYSETIFKNVIKEYDILINENFKT